MNTPENYSPPTVADWNEIARRLREPFDPKDVDFRITGKPKSPDKQAQVAAYVNSRAVMDRLDEVVGVDGWEYDLIPVVLEEIEGQYGKKTKEMTKAKGVLKIHGKAKSDIGTLSNTEASKGCASDAFKRAAVLWGCARYLYELGSFYSKWDGTTDRPYLSRDHIDELRRRLPKPGAPSGGATVSAGNVSTVATPSHPIQASTSDVQEAFDATAVTTPRTHTPAPAGTFQTPAQRQERARQALAQAEAKAQANVAPPPAAPAPVYPDGFDPTHPECPQCSGGMWDNRAKIQSGERKSNSPHFNCKDRENCGKGVWPLDPSKARKKPPTVSPALAENDELDEGYANALAGDADEFDE